MNLKNTEFVMSLWNPFKFLNKTMIKSFEISFGFLNKHNIVPHLITDIRGEKALSHLNWKSIDNSLEKLDLKYNCVWSLGKIISYNIASKKFKNFIHIDGDVFILKNFEMDIEIKNDIIVYKKESSMYYDFPTIFKYCNYKPNVLDVIPEDMFNMCVFGGNSNIIKDYSDIAIDFIFNKDNVNYFCDASKNDTLTHAMIPEQGILGCYINKNNIIPHLINPNLNNTSIRHIPVHNINIFDNLSDKDFINKIESC